MKQILAASIVVGLAAACEQSTPSKAPAPANSPEGRLERLAASNATVVGYLYAADKPYVIASFQNGSLQWRHDPQSKSIIQGPAEPYSEPDKSCVGFAAKNPSMPAQGPERYLVCEAIRPIHHSNSLPRSQDFRLQPGTMFMEYQPPPGTGYPQVLYVIMKK